MSRLDREGAEINASPQVGLRIRLYRTKDVPCGACGQADVVIGPGNGPRPASLRCASCGRHRGWLPLALTDFLAEIIGRFGRPSETITIRNSEFAQANAESRPAQKSAP